MRLNESEIREIQSLAFSAKDDFETWKILKKVSPLDRVKLFDDAEDFFVDSECAELAKAARASKKRSRFHVDRSKVLEHVSQQGYGSMLKSTDGLRFAFIHPSVNDTPRVTFFDREGFSGHSDCKTLEEAALMSFECGIRVPDQPIDIDEMFLASS